jgi:hypothetical protein
VEPAVQSTEQEEMKRHGSRAVVRAYTAPAHKTETTSPTAIPERAKPPIKQISKTKK